MSWKAIVCVSTASALALASIAPHAVAGQESFTSDGSWVVPAGVSVVQVNVTSGSGGDGGRNQAGDGPALGGLALTATAQVPVTPGETIYIGLGENGQDSTTGTAVASGSAFGIGPGGKYTESFGAGGGGGGASAVAINDDIVLIAGGGGGAGGWRAVDDFPSYSGKGGDSGATGNNSSWGPENWTGVGCGDPAPTQVGAGGVHGSSSNGTAASTLTRTGSDGGGAGGDTAAGCQDTGGGAGGAGYYGGLAGTGAGDDLHEFSGGGGGGGSSFASPSRVGIFWSVTLASRGSAPSGSIQYIDIATTGLPDATAGTAYSSTLAAGFSTGTTVNQWSVSPALPAGLSLDSSTGVLSGTASAASAATYTFTASQVSGGTVFARTSVDLALAVVSAPSPNPSVNPTPNGGQDSSASGASDVAPALSAVPPGVFTWQRGTNAAVRVVTNAGSASRFCVDPALPNGLSIDATSGVIEGAPLAPHQESDFRITAVNSRGSSTVKITLSVTENRVSIPAAPVPPSVRFAPRSAKLTTTMKGELDAWLVAQQGRRVALTSVIPRSGKGEALARKRAVQVRKYLRSRDATVQSAIHIAMAQEPVMTRRILFTS